MRSVNAERVGVSCVGWLDHLSPFSRNTRGSKSNGRDEKKQDSADS
jgi:hypothetical protein